MRDEEEDQDRTKGKKMKGHAGPHVFAHAQFLVRLATKIVAFFICLAAFSLVGPAGPICFVDK
jgi:hypothetical protein